jgi:hypothetical protein
MKILSTKVHGILDYLTGIMLIALPWILGFDDVPTATWTVIFVGALIITMSFFTDYETGIVRSLPMFAHLNIDIGTGILFAASPWLLGFADQVYLPHLAMGLFQTIASMLTSRTVPERTQEEVPS